MVATFALSTRSLRFLWALAFFGCSAGERTTTPRDTGMTPTPDASSPDTSAPDMMMSVDLSIDTGPPLDPFDPSNGCGAAAIETQQLPGSVLLVFDGSTSMARNTRGTDPSPGSPSKWDLATGAISSVLTSLPDELSVGLMLFPDPDGSDCNASPRPQVEVAPLGDTRTAILSELTRSPYGGNTPAIRATRAGWDYLRPLPLPGQRGIILVTDGGEGCDRDVNDSSMLHSDARTNNLAFGIQSYAVGLTTTNNLLSGLAFNGGTPRTDSCVPVCTRDGEPCTTNADCGGGNCISLPLIGNSCVGGPSEECCHYDISEAAFAAEFETALREIAESFLDGCIFDLPRGTNPAEFDPGLVNVGVTFAGEGRRVLSRSDDPSVDSWTYTSPANESIEIRGPICEELLSGDATVEIVLGCPTILI